LFASWRTAVKSPTEINSDLAALQEEMKRIRTRVVESRGRCQKELGVLKMDDDMEKTGKEEGKGRW
jgi:hypothetical protein